MDAAFRQRQNSRAAKKLQHIKTLLRRTNPQEIHQNFFNGVCGNNRAASVYGGDAKSKNPGGSARVSGQRNSLRTAIEFRVGDPSYSHWHRRFHWTQQNGQTIEASSFSYFSNFPFVAQANVGRVPEPTCSRINPSKVNLSTKRWSRASSRMDRLDNPNPSRRR